VAAQPSLIHRRLAKTSHRIVPKLTDSSVGSDYDLVGGTKN
jgi:hypothetical protein